MVYLYWFLQACKVYKAIVLCLTLINNTIIPQRRYDAKNDIMNREKFNSISNEILDSCITVHKVWDLVCLNQFMLLV
jgi:hypothetical protein